MNCFSKEFLMTNINYQELVEARLRTNKTKPTKIGSKPEAIYKDGYEDGEHGWKVPMWDPYTGTTLFYRERLDNPKNDQPRYLQPSGKDWFLRQIDWKACKETLIVALS